MCQPIQLQGLWHGLDFVNGKAAEVVFSGLVSPAGSSARAVAGLVDSVLKNIKESTRSYVSIPQVNYQTEQIVENAVSADVDWKVRGIVMCTISVASRLNNVEEAVLDRLFHRTLGLLKD